MMKAVGSISFVALLLLAMSTAFAQEEGEMKDIDGQKFTYEKGVWVHEALEESYALSKNNGSVYKDKKWSKWYSEGDSTLKKILDLGPNVVFTYKGPDGKYHVFGAFKNKKMLNKAVAGGSEAIQSGLEGEAKKQTNDNIPPVIVEPVADPVTPISPI